jgi:hypothetical protein
MEEKLLQIIRDRGHVSFVEIAELFPSETGDVSLAMPEYENIIYWWGLSERLAQAVSSLLERKLAFVHPATPLTYAFDGVMTTMPLATSLRKYSKPHWYPVTLHSKEYSKKV